MEDLQDSAVSGVKSLSLFCGTLRTNPRNDCNSLFEVKLATVQPVEGLELAVNRVAVGNLVQPLSDESVQHLV